MASPDILDIEQPLSAIVEIQKKIDLLLAKITPWKDLDKTPANIVNRRPFHPEMKADNDRAIVMRTMYEYGGLAGLMKALEAFGNENQQPGMAAKVMNPKNYNPVTDEDNLVHGMALLSTMYPAFIEGLIDGDLYYRLAQDERFRRAADLMHRMEKAPGNYVQGLVQGATIKEDPTTVSTALTQSDQRKSNPDHGKGLTMRQWREFYQTAKEYLRATPNAVTLAMNIDQQFLPKPKEGKSVYSGGFRKYVHSKNLERFRTFLRTMKTNWIDRIEAIFIVDPNDPILDQSMRVSMLEIGWGTDTLSRANNHDDHKSSNLLFTWFQAIFKYLFYDEYKKRSFRVERHAVNYIIRDDPLDTAMEEGRLNDIICTMIPQSEWFGSPGLNPVPAGGSGVNLDAMKTKRNTIKPQFEVMFKEGTRHKATILEDRRKIEFLEKVHSVDDTALDQREVKLLSGYAACISRARELERRIQRLNDAQKIGFAANANALQVQSIEPTTGGELSQAPKGRFTVDQFTNIEQAIEDDDAGHDDIQLPDIDEENLNQLGSSSRPTTESLSS